jgi:hypothetical protein
VGGKNRQPGIKCRRFNLASVEAGIIRRDVIWTA